MTPEPIFVHQAENRAGSRRLACTRGHMQRVVTLHIMAGVAGESRFWDPLKSEYPKEASLETADRQSVLRQAEENNVQFIRLWFTHLLRALKNLAITVRARG